MADSIKRRVFVAGHAGMLGAAIVRKLQKCKNVIIITKPKRELDLRDQSEVRAFFEINTIDEEWLTRVWNIEWFSTKEDLFSLNKMRKKNPTKEPKIPEIKVIK